MCSSPFKDVSANVPYFVGGETPKEKSGLCGITAHVSSQGPNGGTGCKKVDGKIVVDWPD